jgi:beta-lactamase regulating signal transducer with metallopeptidase domain
MDALNSAIVLLNHWGRVFCDYGGRIFVQSSILVGLLLLLDLCLRKRVSARFRYGIWLLVLVKLALPPSLALPTGINYWLGKYFPVTSAAPVVSPGPFPFVMPAASATPPGYVKPHQDISAVPDREIVPLGRAGLVLSGWVAGVLALLTIVGRRIAAVKRSLRCSRPARPEMIGLLDECRARLGVAAPVTLRLTHGMHSPCVCGFARPVILLPTSLPPGLGSEGFRAILTHELAHIKRWDPWVSLAQTALQIAYFWHPLVWVANTKLRDLREFAVDETVVTTLRSQAQCYTETLIDIAHMAFRKPAFSLRLIGIAESKRALERRIKHMLNQRIMRHPALGRSGLLTILAIGALLVPMGPGQITARAQQDALQSVPALPPEIPELFELTRDEILTRFGEPGAIFYGDKRYTLNDLPQMYFMSYGDISFNINDGTVVGITLLSPIYVFGNGIHVGDSEQKIKRAFGSPSEVQETEFKDFLTYEPLGLSFEINKQDRSVMEINISREYGDPAILQSYANAPEFIAKLPERIAKLNIDTADLAQVLATFGTPVKYVWGPKTLSPDKLPDRFIAVYPGSFNVFMMNNHIVELRHENGSKYVYTGGLHVGSTLEEALAVLGAPVETVEGKPIDWARSKDVLFKDIEGRNGHCYYHRPELKVRVWFANYKIAAIYMTRSDYGDTGAATPFDAGFASLLAERIARLDIDTAGPDEVRMLFGEPSRYVWGNQTFSADALPETNYIMCYPCSFNVWLQKGRIMEIRHERGSQYAYRGTLRVGSTLQEALDLLGQPTETVAGQENEFKDGVLYRDIDGDTGHDYYHRSDQKVRVWFADDKVIAIYMTRSDYPVK